MSKFNFYFPLPIRYADLDAQWNVNNARDLTFLEQTRMEYFMNLGLFDGEDFFSLGFIVADIHIAYAAPIVLREKIRAGMRVARLGNKSFTVEYEIENEESGELKARAEVVMVAYDYSARSSVPITAEMRAKIMAFEGMDSA